MRCHCTNFSGHGNLLAGVFVPLVQIFENQTRRKIFGSHRQDALEKERRFCCVEFHNQELFLLLLRWINRSKYRRTCIINRKNNAYSILVGKPKCKISIRNPTLSSNDSLICAFVKQVEKLESFAYFQVLGTGS